MKKILVVDDSQTARNYHRGVLQGAGFSINTAVDGADGLEKLLQNQMDIILTDINMTRMDGYEFIRRVRQQEGYESIPIVIVSTNRRTEDKREGYTAGANLYLTKPCSPELLIESVRMLMR